MMSITTNIAMTTGTTTWTKTFISYELDYLLVYGYRQYVDMTWNNND